MKKNLIAFASAVALTFASFGAAAAPMMDSAHQPQIMHQQHEHEMGMKPSAKKSRMMMKKRNVRKAAPERHQKRPMMHRSAH